MITIANGKYLEVLLSSPVYTTELQWSCSFLDKDATTIRNLSQTLAQPIIDGRTRQGITNGITPVIIIPATKQKEVQLVDIISVYNSDTSSAVVTIRTNDGSTIEIANQITLQVGYTLVYNQFSGWDIFDDLGNQLITASGGTSSTGGGITYSGIVDAVAYFNTTNSLTSSNNFIFDGSYLTLSGSFEIDGLSSFKLNQLNNTISINSDHLDYNTNSNWVFLSLHDSNNYWYDLNPGGGLMTFSTANTSISLDEANTLISVIASSVSILGKLKYQDGTQANGYILTSDANGVASWSVLPTAITYSGVTDGVAYFETTNYLTSSTNFLFNGSYMTLSGTFSMSSHKIINLATGSNPLDAVNHGQMIAAIASATASETLSQVLASGNTTGGNNIIMSSGDIISTTGSGGVFQITDTFFDLFTSGGDSEIFGDANGINLISINGISGITTNINMDAGGGQSIVYRVAGGGSETDITQTNTFIQVYSDYASFIGISYQSDYSANYTNRSLIDKGYADATYYNNTPSSNGILYQADGTHTSIDVFGQFLYSNVDYKLVLDYQNRLLSNGIFTMLDFNTNNLIAVTISMNNHKIINLATGSSALDAVNYGQMIAAIASSTASETLTNVLIAGNSAGSNQINMNSNKIINLATGSNPLDAVNYGQLSTLVSLQYVTNVGNTSSNTINVIKGWDDIGYLVTGTDSTIKVIIGNDSSNAGYISLYDDIGSGTIALDGIDGSGSFNYLNLGGAFIQDGYIHFNNATNNKFVAIKASTTTATYTMSLPTTQGSADTLLTNDGSGNLSWAAAPASGITYSGITNSIAFFKTPTSLTSSTNLTFDGNYLTVSVTSSYTNTMVFTEISDPAGLAGSGKGYVYADTTHHVLNYKDNTGTYSNTVIPNLGVTHQFVTAIARTGLITTAQPNLTDIVGNDSQIVYGDGSGALTSSSNLIFNGSFLTVSGTMSMQSHKIINVATGSNPLDAVNYGQLTAATNSIQNTTIILSGAVYGSGTNSIATTLATNSTIINLLVTGLATYSQTLSMSQSKIINLATASNPLDAVNLSQLSAYTNSVPTSLTYSGITNSIAYFGTPTSLTSSNNLTFDGNYLTVSGTMSMQSHKIINVATGSNPLDAVNYGQLLTLVKMGMVASAISSGFGYVFGSPSVGAKTNFSLCGAIMPYDGVITRVYMIAWAASGGESGKTLTIYKNGSTTGVSVSTFSTLNAGKTDMTGLSISVSKGDYIEFNWSAGATVNGLCIDGNIELRRN